MNYGDAVTVSCTISGGDLPVTTKWYFNGGLLKFNENLQDVILEKRGQRINNLMIEALSSKHIGNFTCSSENRAGITEFSAALNVNGLFVIELNSYP